MSSQTIVLISGANRGLGFETAKNLILSENHNYQVLLGGRDLSKAQKTAETLNALPNIKGGVSPQQKSPSKLGTFSHLDILVNNTAIYILNPADSGSALRATLDTNVIGVAELTESFLPLLRRSKSPRLILVSSSNDSMTYNLDPDSPYGGTFAIEYRVSKAALNMLLMYYYMSLKDIVVLGVDPEFCATEAIGDSDALRKRGAVERDVGGGVVASVVRGDGGRGGLCMVLKGSFRGEIRL
ncbi:uncharacterized protein BDV14DRAFT_190467 [Aspergillus stella-maris]|uniref:uncharacterized protein n=1 Tax=Aspergillus stella-maris TaxID=1810926 RepID=UPI003CCCA124